MKYSGKQKHILKNIPTGPSKKTPIYIFFTLLFWALCKSIKPFCYAKGIFCILKWCIAMKEHSNDL